MWNVFKKVWVKAKGVKAEYNGQRRIASGNKLPQTLTQSQMSSLRMRGSRANNTASFVGDIFPNKRALSQCRYDSALGRSMIEMLGVLAIIGVLSIAAVAGYRFALLKFRANEVTNELNMRAINVSAQMLNTGTVYEKNELIEDGFGDTLTVGFPVETAISDRNTDYFEILVSDIPADLCRQILRDYENPIMIFVNNVRYNADTTICDDETQNALNDMGFIYKNDLGTHEACSEKGYFDEEDFQCHCSGNTYLDIYTNDCLCPAGHIWSAGEGTCIESICPEGEFESLTAGCVPCSDETTYTIATDERHKQLCEASTCGRIVVGSNCVNADINNCKAGESFRKDNGECVACSTPSRSIIIGTDPDNLDLCNSCPNRSAIVNTCMISPYCNAGQVPYVNPNYGAYCSDCSSTEKLSIGENDEAIQACNACRNDLGEKSRTYQDGYCRKTACDSDEFMGSDGQCHKCTQPAKVAVNTDSGCEKATCNRIEVSAADGKTYCQIKNCPTDGSYVSVNGSCYPCNRSINFTATRSQCESCKTQKRFWNGTYINEHSTGDCMPQDCILGEGYPISRSCISCYSFYGDGFIAGTTEIQKLHCQACNGYTAESGCFSNNSCEKGKQFRSLSVENVWAPVFCTDCGYTEKIEIGTTAGHRDMCSACTTKPRFWVGSYCYRCDSPETPDVTSTDEEKSCRTCDEREVKDGKCVLIQ